MSEDVTSKIAELEKELYTKEFKPHEVSGISRKQAPEAPQPWDYSTEAATFVSDLGTQESEHWIMKGLTKKILIFSIIFFVIASGIAGYMYWKGANVVSGENIEFEASAPVAVTGGEPFEAKITVLNNNAVPIESAKLILNFDSGFYSSEKNIELTHVSQELGKIEQGQLVTQSIVSALYGEENTEKVVSALLEYRVVGSNAIIQKKTSYTVKITSSPVVLKLKTLKEASSGQAMEFSFDVESNSKEPLKNLLVEAMYPLGFTYESADPSPTYGNNVWSIPALSPQAVRTIKVRGSIQGEDGSGQVTKISVGTQSPKDERVLGIVFNSTTETFQIAKSAFLVNVSTNGNPSPEVSVPAGQGVRMDLSWQNNDTARVTDVVVEATLRGEALNRYSVFASNGGFYRSADNTIVWNKAVNPSLANVNIGARGSMSFSFTPAVSDPNATQILKNPQVTVDIKVRARRISESSVSDDILSIISRKVKIETQLTLAAKGLHYSGPLENTGPMPPRAEQDTTYTLVWTLRNATNNVSNVSVRGILPVYVRWANVISPSGEPISYNESNSEVLWTPGSIPAGATREVFFQVVLNPSISQIGQTPNLISESVLTGTDDFAKSPISSRRPVIKTSITSDPQFVQKEGAVVK